MSDIEELRRLAEEATPGLWIATVDPLGFHVGGVRGRIALAVPSRGRGARADAEFIAAANPQVILALLDELEALRAVKP